MSSPASEPGVIKTSEGGGTLPSAVEFEPPQACVRRILKHSLPSSTNVSKDASTACARASGIFIIYVTACANDFARENKRQTITANDVLAAMKELGFDEFTEEMNEHLESYRKTEKSKKNAKALAKQQKEDEATSSSPIKDVEIETGKDESETKDFDDDDDEEEETTEPNESMKRLREEEEEIPTAEVVGDKEPDAKRLKTQHDSNSEEASDS